MEILGLILMGIGAIISIVYSIILIIESFKTSVIWGLVYLFVPFGALIFIIVHWDKAGSPFLKSLLSIPFFVIGIMIAGTSLMDPAGP